MYFEKKYCQKLIGLVHQFWFICYLKTRWSNLFTPQIHNFPCAVLPCGVEGNSSLGLWPYHYFSIYSYTFYYWSQSYSSPFSNSATLFDSMPSHGSGSQRQFSAFAMAAVECLMLKDENTLSDLWCLKRGERPQDLSAYYKVQHICMLSAELACLIQGQLCSTIWSSNPPSPGFHILVVNQFAKVGIWAKASKKIETNLNTLFCCCVSLTSSLNSTLHAWTRKSG